MKNNSVIKPITAIAIAAFFLAFCFDLGTDTLKCSSYVFLVLCTVAVILVFRKSFPRTAVFYTMLAGMFLKLSYVMYTPVWCRQHDVVDFGAGEGHAAYIEYILANKALPDFDPREVWAFFQPPLHHFISAAWMWLGLKCNLSADHVHKNVQILPLCYMCALALITLMICRELSMKSGGTLITMLIVSFHPIYILMSGSINNDALATVLTVASVYVAILWHRKQSYGLGIVLAAFIGFSMMAKLSSVLVAFPIGIMMLYDAYNGTERFKSGKKMMSYLLRFIVFGAVVFPLGLWWPIRNKIRFGMDMGYIPEVGEAVMKKGFVPQILDIRTRSPFLYMKANGFEYDEYNLILATFKSSLFGEGDFAKISPAVTAAAAVLLFASVAAAVIGIIAVIKTCASEEAHPEAGIKILLAGCVVSFIAGYVIFALKQANLSAMDFRYSAAAVSVLAVFSGLWYDRLQALGKKGIRRIMMAVSVIAAAASAFVYIAVGTV